MVSRVKNRAVVVVLPVALVVAYACGGSSNTASSAPDGGDQSADGSSSLAADGAVGASDAARADGAASASDAAMTPDAATLLAMRPYQFHAPFNYDPKTPAPLVVMFHGYGATALEQEYYFQLVPASETHGFLYAYADGTLDKTNERFWNADDACCDLYHAGVDDVAYFDAIVGDVKAKYNVDPKRIYVVGHSNGGFMSHRLACDRASTVAAIVSLAGAVWNDPQKCAPSAHVSIAEVHGDADTTIVYAGGSTPEGTYPGAQTTVATWASKNGCTGALAPTSSTLDLDTVLPGAETNVQAYAGCPAGIGVELWTIQGGSHIPTLAHPTWGDAVWAFMAAHAKP
jgi:polyhydroxybutyrate depolymerase